MKSSNTIILIAALSAALQVTLPPPALGFIYVACTGQPDNVCPDQRDRPASPTCGCQSGCGGSGMPVWFVSEPYINIRLEDEPFGYQPARGPRVAFNLSYRQRGAILEDPKIFGLGPNWSCSFRSFLVDLTTNTPGLLRLHRGGAGWIDYTNTDAQYADGSILSGSAGNY